MEGFGLNKEKLSKRLAEKGVEIYTGNSGDTIYYYDKNGDLILYYRSSNITQCSSVDIGHIHAYKERFKGDILEACKEIISRRYGSKVVMSRQNVSKDGYLTLIALGFIDIFRVPGNYVNTYQLMLPEQKIARKDNCISIMLLSGQPLMAGIKKTLSLIKDKYPVLTDIAEKSIVKEVILPNTKNLYICMVPTGTLTKHKLYKGMECIPDKTKLCIINDNGKSITLNKDRFLLTK